MTDATQEVEVKILSIIRVKKNYYKYKNILQSGFFSSEETRQIFFIVDKFFAAYDKAKLTTQDMKLEISRKVTDKELKTSCLKLVRVIRRTKTIDTKVIEESIKDFAKRNWIKTIVTEALTLLEQPTPDLISLRDHIEKAINLSTETAEDLYAYFKDPNHRMEEAANEKKISTCIPKLDKELAGGMSPGELFVFLGPPGRGKTTALINIGVGALIQGLTVMHVTLEISARGIARRYDMRLTGKKLAYLKRNPHLVERKLRAIRKAGGDLIIKDYSMESPRIDDLHAMILNYQHRTGKQIDMLVVDYGDLLHSNKNHKDTRFALEEIYTDLRRLGVKMGFPVYTASQTNRESLDKQVVGMKEVAESFGKVKVADVVVGLCQSPEEKDEKLITLFIAKSRKTSGHGKFRLTLDTDRMYMGELGSEWTNTTKPKSTFKTKKNWQ